MTNDVAKDLVLNTICRVIHTDTQLLREETMIVAARIFSELFQDGIARIPVRDALKVLSADTCG